MNLHRKRNRKKKKSKSAPKTTTVRTENDDDISITFARRLASNDKQLRDRTIKRLKEWLERRADVSEEEMMKIWKGLFYCFWMSDKVPVQQELANKLSQIVLSLGIYRPKGGKGEKGEEKGDGSTDNSEGAKKLNPHPLMSRSLLYVRCFFVTMLREWNGIDRLRMDKYMSLVRKFIRSIFLLLSAWKWKPDAVDEIASLLSELPLHPTQSCIGFFLHVTDCFIDELSAVLRDTEDKRLEKERLLLVKKQLVVAGVDPEKVDKEIPHNKKGKKKADASNEMETEEGESGEGKKNEAAVEGKFSMPFEALESLLMPFFTVLSESHDSIRHKRVEEAIFKRLLNLSLPPQSEMMEEEGEEGYSVEEKDDADGVLREVMTGNAKYIADRLFELASDTKIKAKLRKSLFELRDEFSVAQQRIDMIMKLLGGGEYGVGIDDDEEEENGDIEGEEEGDDMEEDEENDGDDAEEEEEFDEENSKNNSMQIEKSTPAATPAAAKSWTNGKNATPSPAPKAESTEQKSSKLSSSNTKPNNKKRTHQQLETVEETITLPAPIAPATASSYTDANNPPSAKKGKASNGAAIMQTPTRSKETNSAPSGCALKNVTFNESANQVQLFHKKSNIRPKEDASTMLAKPSPAKTILKRTNSPIVETKLTPASKQSGSSTPRSAKKTPKKLSFDDETAAQLNIIGAVGGTPTKKPRAEDFF